MTNKVSLCPSVPCSFLLRLRPSINQPFSEPELNKKYCAELPSVPLHHCPSPTVTVLPQSLTGSFEEAGAHLQKVLHPSPPSEAARARRGLLRLKKGDVVAAAQDLQCLAEMDAQDLGFLLCLLEASERQSLTQVGTAPLRVPSPAPLRHLGCETPRSGALGSAASPPAPDQEKASGSGQLKP